MLTLENRDIRYANLRAAMARENLDAMLVICDAQIEKKGLLKYLTNYRNTLYNLVAIFPLNGEPKLLVPSPVQQVWAARRSWINDVVLEKPALEPVLVKEIQAMGLDKARMGIASLKIMNAHTYTYLVENLPEATFVEASSLIDDLRIIKAEEELELVRETAALAVKSFEYCGEVLKPGMTELELEAQIDAMLLCNGAQDIFHLICSKPGDIMPFVATDRKIEKGDSVILNTELSGPSGYWIQMVRTIFVGKPADEIVEMYKKLLEICNKLPEMMVPGARCCDIAQWVIDQTEAAGYQVGVYFGHGQGLDVVEKPNIAVNDDTVLQANMVVTVHPQFVSQDKQNTVWYADCYRVREEGPAEILTETPADFLELDF